MIPAHTTQSPGIHTGLEHGRPSSHPDAFPRKVPSPLLLSVRRALTKPPQKRGATAGAGVPGPRHEPTRANEWTYSVAERDAVVGLLRFCSRIIISKSRQSFQPSSATRCGFSNLDASHMANMTDFMAARCCVSENAGRLGRVVCAGEKWRNSGLMARGQSSEGWMRVSAASA